ncbi:DUF3419 family protein [Roseinatronobacter sp. NSM]|uniref:DUF3419 family protein n=1 Tax=Roseinatronobacter sp. NSM TaxID=3457785 RepID=UPI004036E487
MSDASEIMRRIDGAVCQNPVTNRIGLQERLFARLFQGLVYAQIWEDPVADMAALDLSPGSDIICIASGGCNTMSYLLTDPASVTAVDLSPAHIALLNLKRAAATHLEQPAFFNIFGHADRPGNPALIQNRLAPHLDPESRAFWQRHAKRFARGFYRQGVLGRFIGAVHLVGRVAKVDFRPLLQAQSLAEQEVFFTRQIDPLFDKRMVRYLARQRAALFGLGIPPAQHDKLAADAQGDIVRVLRARARRLVCDFPVKDNYFLWQAFHRGYEPGTTTNLPPYLQRANFNAVAARAGRIRAVNHTFTDELVRHAPHSLDAYILLDAQDWMTDAQLNTLWAEITRTARPGARVLFRTGGTDDILPGRVSDQVMSFWAYDPAASNRAFAQDRSAIYGGVHLYRYQG